MTDQPAGRELDALVAEKVMGIEGPFDKDGIHHEYKYPAPLYSTDIAAAWEVVKKLRENHRYWVTIEGIGRPDQVWRATLQRVDPINTEGWRQAPVSQIAETAPLAICRAALKTGETP